MPNQKWRVKALAFVLAMGFSTAALAQGLYSPDASTVAKLASQTEWVHRFETAKSTVDGFAVVSVEEFVRMNEYHRAFADDGVAVHTFQMKNGERIRCVDIRTQASVRAAGLDPATMPLAPVGLTVDSDDESDGVTRHADFGLDGSIDADGHARACPAGSFPKLIPGVERLYRFRHLADVFKKYPGDEQTPPFLRGSDAERDASRAITHEYGIVYAEEAGNQGLIADFNLWSPYVQLDSEFSLSQLWVARGDGSDLQTVETGWQNYAGLYGNHQSHLFIFYTTQNYNDGCYNLDCGAFVQTDGSVVIAGGWSDYSEDGGNQIDIHLGFIRDGNGGGHWWLRYGTKWVGYYPTNLFDAAGIKNGNDIVNFGGELIDSHFGGHTDSGMGSGKFPNEGYTHAAYIRNVQYVNASADYIDAQGLFSEATVPECWGINDADYGDPEFGTSFYFGGACGACEGCLIDNVCYGHGDTQPGNDCRVCDTAVSETQWSDNDGATCDDNQFCNGVDTCVGSTCSNHAGDPCDPGDECNESSNSCEGSDDDVDDDADDDSDDDDDDGGDDSGDDDAGVDCGSLLQTIYDQCGFEIASGGSAMSGSTALNLCASGGDVWECLADCKGQVNACADLAECASQECGVSLGAESSSSGRGDDDDDGGGCGC